MSSASTPESGAAYRDHRRIISAMIDDLRRVQSHAERLGLSEAVDRAASVLHRVENQYFTVAVVGEFKRGKSTLINALLGKEILPADVLPCSATLNRVTYGVTPSVELHFKSSGEQPARVDHIPIDELINYVTKLTPESEETAANIREAIIRYPVKYCRDGVDILDTPGLNDDENMTAVTFEALSQVDAAILVILAQSPFSETERQFLNHMLSEDMGRVMFVANRIDEIRKPEDRKRVVASIEARIRKSLEERAAALHGRDTAEYQNFLQRAGKPKVFGVSGGQALDARIESDDALLQKSGFLEFEAELERFLTNERGATSLQILADCSVAVCNQLLSRVEIEEGALQMSAEQFEAAYRNTSAQLRSLSEKFNQEMSQVDRAAATALARGRVLLAQYEAELKQAVSAAIDALQVTPQDVDKQRQQTMERLGKQVADAAQLAIQTLGEKIQLEIDRELSREIGRLGSFASEVSTALTQIEFQFTQANPESSRRSSAVEGALVTVPIVGGLFISNLAFGLGGVVAGYREAGVKGAVVGGAAGLASGTLGLFGAGFAAAMIGLPITWPVVLAVGLVGGVSSFMGGREVTRLAFAQQRADRFKEDFKVAVLARIHEGAPAQIKAFDQKLQEQIVATFEQLKTYINAELGAPIDQTRRTLDDLRVRLEGSRTDQAIKLRELETIRNDARNVQHAAVARASTLRLQRSNATEDGTA